MMNDIIPEYKPERDEKNLAMLVHLLPFLGFMIPGMNIVIPLVLWFMKRDQSPYLDHHAREELNFQITISVALAVWIALKMMLVGLLLLPLIPIAIILVLVFMVRAAIMASRGEYYKYPFTLRLVS